MIYQLTPVQLIKVQLGEFCLGLEIPHKLVIDCLKFIIIIRMSLGKVPPQCLE